MALALYAPGLGYYSAGIAKWGNDFITAPEISPLFSQSVAKQCQQILAELGEDSVILELGAGSGIMAVEILKELDHLHCLPHRYLILEVSAKLRWQQQEKIQQQLPTALWQRVQWLDTLPSQPLRGIILANEVLDAMPVHRFRVEASEVLEFHVSLADSIGEMPLRWQLLPSRNELLREAVAELRATLPTGYESEINLALPAWINSLADILAQGLILLVDYGFPQREYYHSQRSQGTLICHYQHQVHDNPLILIGLQDITAHVNFTAVAEAAVATDLQVTGYTTQGDFLLACGILERLAAYDPNDSVTYLRIAQQVKTLLLPSEMGELFKVIALTRQLDNMPLLGFKRNDLGKL
jgi:SAM-dependent MidA family methyltransferase